MQPVFLLALISLCLLMLTGSPLTFAAEPLVNSSDIQDSALDAYTQQRWISAIGNDDVGQLNKLVQQFHPASLISLKAPNGKSALMVASKKGDAGLAETLVKAGASVHDTTSTNGTAFMFAVLGNQRATAEWLLAQGAKLDIVGSNGWTALTIAAAKGNLSMLRWLIAEGADAQVRDVYRYTPFLRSVENGYLDTAKYLLSLEGTDINAQDEYDNTALHHSVSAVNQPMIQLLLDAGANPSIKNRDGQVPGDLVDDNVKLKAMLEKAVLAY